MDSVSMASSEISMFGPFRKGCFSLQDIELLKNSVSSTECDNYQRMNQIMRSIDCCACQEPFLYQLRSHPNFVFCSATCLLAASKKVTTDDLSTHQVGLSEAPTPVPHKDDIQPEGKTNVKMVDMSIEDYMNLRYGPAKEKPIVSIARKGLDSFLASGKGTESHSNETYEPKPIVVGQHSDKHPPTSLASANAEVPMDSRTEQANVANKENKSRDARAAPSAKIWTTEDLALSPEFVEGAQVVIAGFTGPNEILLTAAGDFERINDLQKSLEPYCLQAPVLEDPPRVNDILFVRDQYNEVWLRATVKKVFVDECNKHFVTVEALERGYQLDLPLDSCRWPCPDIMEKHPMVYNIKFALDYKSKSMPNYRTELLPFSGDEMFTLHFTENIPSVHPKRGDIFFQNGQSAMDVLQKYLVGPAEKPEASSPTKTTASKEGESMESRVGYSKQGEKTGPSNETKGSSGNKPWNKNDSNGQRIQNGGGRNHEGQDSRVSKFDGRKENLEKDILKALDDRQTESKKPEKATAVSPEPSVQETPKAKEDAVKKSDAQSEKSDATEQDQKKEKTNFAGMAISTNLRQGAKVQVSFFYALGRVSINAVDDIGNLDELQNLISDYVQKATRITTRPSIDDVIIAPYRKGDYYRARVIGFKKPRNLIVEFIDYGDQEELCASDCFHISSELFQIPVYGIEAFVDQVPEDVLVTDAAINDLNSSSWWLEVLGKPNYASWKVQLSREDGQTYTAIAATHAK